MLSVDKFSIIQNAFAMTGNTVSSTEDEDPDAWAVGSRAFDRSVGVLVTSHNWNFATRTKQLTGPLLLNPSQRYERAFQKPNDCLHIIAIFNQFISETGEHDVVDAYAIAEYEIVADKICTSRGDPLFLKYLVTPNPEDTHPLFIEALTLMVEAGILQGLNEDYNEGRVRMKMAQTALDDAKARTDMQTPPRAFRKSGLRQARRLRRG